MPFALFLNDSLPGTEILAAREFLSFVATDGTAERRWGRAGDLVDVPAPLRHGERNTQLADFWCHRHAAWEAEDGDGDAEDVNDTESPSPWQSLRLVPGPADGEAVFMGFDFDAPVEWKSPGSIHVSYLDHCEWLDYWKSLYRLDPPWNGFGEALAWGDAEGRTVGLKFFREEPMSFDWQAWADGVVQAFPADCGMELRHRESCADAYEIWSGSAGELEALLSVGHVTRFDNDGTTVESVSRLLELVVQRRGATVPAPETFAEPP